VKCAKNENMFVCIVVVFYWCSSENLIFILLILVCFFTFNVGLNPGNFRVMSELSTGLPEMKLYTVSLTF